MIVALLKNIQHLSRRMRHKHHSLSRVHEIDEQSLHNVKGRMDSQVSGVGCGG